MEDTHSYNVKISRLEDEIARFDAVLDHIQKLMPEDLKVYDRIAEARDAAFRLQQMRGCEIVVFTSLTQRNLVIKYKANEDMKGDIKILITGTWDADVQQLKNKAFKKGFATENIDLLVKGFGHLYSGEAADIFAEIKHGVTRETEAAKIIQATNAEDDKKPKINKYYIQKYHSLAEGNELYEAVLVGKDAYFVSLDRDKTNGQFHSRLTSSFSIPNALANTIIEILPRENMTYLSKPYHFESQKEIDGCLQKASGKTLD